MPPETYIDMKKSLDHLPEHFQEDIKTITDTLAKHRGVCIIVLFGSFARGNYVDEDWRNDFGMNTVYKSDYDFFVVCNKSQWIRTNEEKLKQEVRELELVSSRGVDMVFEPWSTVQKRLKQGQFFFVDSFTEGIELFNRHDWKLPAYTHLPDEVRLEVMDEHFTVHIQRAKGFLVFYDTGMMNKLYSHTVFLMHQCAESCYAGMNLVITNYHPKEHDLNKLEDEWRKPSMPSLKEQMLSKGYEKEWNKLVLAYIEARYNPNFSITEEQLTIIYQEVAEFYKQAEERCREELRQARKTYIVQNI